MSLPLLPHQIEGVKYILNNSSAYVCDDMGMGKTRTVIEAMFRRGAFPILVVCPASLKINWKNEIKRWIGVDVNIDDLQSPIIITNYERMKKYKFQIPKLGVKQIVIDECHSFKNPKAQRTKIALEWSKNIPYKILITGTPMLNRPVEMLTQMQILNNIHLLGGEKEFLKRYCSPRNSQYGIDYSGFSNLTSLHKKMSRIWLRRTKKDLKNSLPEKKIIPVPIMELEQPSPKTFQDIERFDKAVTQRKLTMSIDFIQNLLDKGEKVVVFVHHKEIGKQINLAFPNSSVIVGGQSPSIRQRNIDNFQLGDTPLIICSLQASAVGLTLTASRCAVFIEYPWSPTLLRQAQDRVHRLGQDRDVFIYYLYASKSIDEYRMNTSNFKDVIINKIIGD